MSPPLQVQPASRPPVPRWHRRLVSPACLAAALLTNTAFAGPQAPPAASSSVPVAPDEPAAEEDGSPDSVLLAGISLLVVGAVAGGIGAALVALGQDEAGDSSKNMGIAMIIGGGTCFAAGVPVTIVGGVILSDSPEPSTAASPTPTLSLRLSF